MASSSSSKGKPRFSKEEDSVIVHEVYATRAFCALKNASKLYAEVASTLNGKDFCKREVSWKSVSDRFSRLAANWRKSDKYKRGLSGVSEEYCEEDKLMCSMVAAMDDIDEERAAVRQAGQLKKEKQKTLDNTVKECAMNRRIKKRTQDEVEEDRVEAAFSPQHSVTEDPSDFSSQKNQLPRKSRKITL